MGGHNVGDEYLGKDPKFGPWRDTHVKITGPAVLQMQVSLLEDYHWATGKLLELDWKPVPAPEGDAAVLILPSGPADELETASLMCQQAIHSARQRIWIASPYFVPDESEAWGQAWGVGAWGQILAWGQRGVKSLLDS